MTTTDITTLYFSNAPQSIIINNILDETLTQTDISNALSNVHTFSDISGITIGTDVTKLQSFLFSGCFNLQSIVIYNTDIITDIGLDIFNDVSSNGIYSFYSSNNYLTRNVTKLISLLPPPPAWVSSSDIIYNYYTDFAILCNELTHINKNNADNYNLTPIDISYTDFHTLFFPNNSYFNLNINNYGIHKISQSDLKRYTTINLQTEQIYLNEDLTNPPVDISFNLLSTVLNHYQYNFPSQNWSIESSIQINKQLSNLKTIFNFQNNKCCQKCNKSKCNNTCVEKNNTKLTIDDFFNMFESQGIEMAIDNSFNSVPITAKGLPIDAAIIKYTAILTLYLRSNNCNVNDVSIRMPYLINFSDSMPKNSNPNTNNYRYNPYF